MPAHDTSLIRLINTFDATKNGKPFRCDPWQMFVAGKLIVKLGQPYAMMHITDMFGEEFIARRISAEIYPRIIIIDKDHGIHQSLETFDVDIERQKTMERGFVAVCVAGHPDARFPSAIVSPISHHTHDISRVVAV